MTRGRPFLSPFTFHTLPGCPGGGLPPAVARLLGPLQTQAREYHCQLRMRFALRSSIPLGCSSLRSGDTATLTTAETVRSVNRLGRSACPRRAGEPEPGPSDRRPREHSSSIVPHPTLLLLPHWRTRRGIRLRPVADGKAEAGDPVRPLGLPSAWTYQAGRGEMVRLGFQRVPFTGYPPFHRAKVVRFASAGQGLLRFTAFRSETSGLAVKFILASAARACSSGNFPQPILDRPASFHLPALRN